MRFPAMASALVIALAISTLGCSAGPAISCPAALAEGVLVADGASLGLQGLTGAIEPVRWDGWYEAHEQDGVRILVDRGGAPRARAGDFVRFGGGEGPDGVFHACGTDLAVVAPPG